MIRHKLTCNYCGRGVELSLDKETRLFDFDRCFLISEYHGYCPDCRVDYKLKVRYNYTTGEDD